MSPSFIVFDITLLYTERTGKYGRLCNTKIEIDMSRCDLDCLYEVKRKFGISHWTLIEIKSTSLKQSIL